MTQAFIGVGALPNDGTGDAVRDAFIKTNANFDELYSGLDGKAATVHTHAQSDVTGLGTSLSGKADAVHTHAQSDVTGLEAALAGKSDVGHTHPGGSQAFPVGAVFIAVVNTNPATLLGYGTWSAFAAGRMLVGVDTGDVDFDTAEEVGGAKTHTLTESEMPVHTHVQDAHSHTQNSHNHVQDAHSHLTQRYPTATGSSSGFTIDTSMSGTLAANTLPTQATTATNQAATATNQNATATNQNAGGGAAHNNMPPYIAVYMWKRTA